MSQITKDFIELIKKRSDENEKSINALFEQKLIGNCISILRQEIDTFIRIIYLGLEPDLAKRERLMKSTLNGEKWKILTLNNKLKNVTDREMVDLSTRLKGYVEYVYKFGCSFIHLSDYHNYKEENPFDKITLREKLDIKFYLKQYHDYPRNLELTVESVSEYLPKIFKKISSNMLYYNEELLEERIINF